MTIKMTGFFCKTDDPKIYNAMRVSNVLYNDTPEVKDDEDVITQQAIVGEKTKWLETEGNIVIEQDFQPGNPSGYCIIDGVVCLDEIPYIAENKAKLVRSLSDYRWDMFNTKLYVGTTLIDVDVNGRTELNFNLNSFNAMPELDRPETVPFKELNDAGWLEVDPTDAIAWQIMITMSDSVESRTAQQAVEVLIDALDTCVGVDGFNVATELDDILKPILMADLAKYAYPVKYHNEDLA
jgi:hypothetical protein